MDHQEVDQATKKTFRFVRFALNLGSKLSLYCTEHSILGGTTIFTVPPNFPVSFFVCRVESIWLVSLIQTLKNTNKIRMKEFWFCNELTCSANNRLWLRPGTYPKESPVGWDGDETEGKKHFSDSSYVSHVTNLILELSNPQVWFHTCTIQPAWSMVFRPSLSNYPKVRSGQSGKIIGPSPDWLLPNSGAASLLLETRDHDEEIMLYWSSTRSTL